MNHKSQTGLGHNGTTRLSQFLKRLLLEGTQKISTAVWETLFAMSNNKPANTKSCLTPPKSSLEANGLHFNGFDRSN